MAKRPPPRPDEPPRVLLLIETSTSWGTGICEGIAQYAQEHGRWRFTIEPTGKNDLLRLPKNWKGDGVLARVNSQALADDLVASRLPAVNVSWYHFGFPDIPRCTANEAACAELAMRAPLRPRAAPLRLHRAAQPARLCRRRWAHASPSSPASSECSVQGLCYA